MEVGGEVGGYIACSCSASSRFSRHGSHRAKGRTATGRPRRGRDGATAAAGRPTGQARVWQAGPSSVPPRLLAVPLTSVRMVSTWCEKPHCGCVRVPFTKATTCGGGGVVGGGVCTGVGWDAGCGVGEICERAQASVGMTPPWRQATAAAAAAAASRACLPRRRVRMRAAGAPHLAGLDHLVDQLLQRAGQVLKALARRQPDLRLGLAGPAGGRPWRYRWCVRVCVCKCEWGGGVRGGRVRVVRGVRVRQQAGAG